MRDIVGRIDTERLGSVTAAELAALSGPALRLADDRQVEARARVYILPVQGKVVSGFNELNTTGYRERGMRLSVAPEAQIVAPAAGKVSFAGRYRSYGQIVILEHGNGWNSLITHLGTIKVAKGFWVWPTGKQAKLAWNYARTAALWILPRCCAEARPKYVHGLSFDVRGKRAFTIGSGTL
jgi:Peptidase family M23